MRQNSTKKEENKTEEGSKPVEEPKKEEPQKI